MHVLGSFIALSQSFHMRLCFVSSVVSYVSRTVVSVCLCLFVCRVFMQVVCSASLSPPSIFELVLLNLYCISFRICLFLGQTSPKFSATFWLSVRYSPIHCKTPGQVTFERIIGFGSHKLHLFYSQNSFVHNLFKLVICFAVDR